MPGKRARKPSSAWLVGGALSAVMLQTALPRIESREAMWTEVLRRDPGDETGAGYVAQLRARAGKPAEALSVLRACAAFAAARASVDDAAALAANASAAAL